MQFFYWLVFLVVIGIAIFAVQNSTAPAVVMKFLLWRFETSLIYTILVYFGLGILITLPFWITRAIRASLRVKKLLKEIEDREMKSFREGDRLKGIQG